MPTPLIERLKTARRRQFVGREEECDWFKDALDSDELPFYVMHVYGPGGVGKTSLLKEFGAMCAESDAWPLYIDARNLDVSPNGFVNAVQHALDASQNISRPLFENEKELCKALTDLQRRCVVLIDTYETLAPLDSWIHEELLLCLPDNVMLVLAGRQAPSSIWRSDPVYGTLIRAWSLRNLAPDEARSYLAQRNIPDAQHVAVMNFTHGHPLALSLVADTFAQRDTSSSAPFQPEESPDVIRVLLERFVQQVPGLAHRAALEAFAIVRVLTEGLLSYMLNMSDVHELFEWLRTLSFVDSGRFGIFPHDLAREAIVADVRWRNPDWNAELHKRARTYYKQRLESANELEQQRILFDFTFLHRDNQAVRQFLDWQESGSTRIERANANDLDFIMDTVRRHEGESSAMIVSHWWIHQPHSFNVMRQTNGNVCGLLQILSMHDLTEDVVSADAIAFQAWAYLKRHAPLRQGEHGEMFRMWMACDTYQQVGATQSLIFIRMVQTYFQPRLAFTFFTCAEPAFWNMLMTYADFEQPTELAYEIEGKPYGMFVHDWRATTVTAWLELLAEREMAMGQDIAPKPKTTTQVIALSEEDFGEALRETLKLMSRSQTLRGNALLGSRLVIDKAGAGADEIERTKVLRKIMIDAIETLNGSPRDVKLYRALYHTFIKPAASQEQASEIIDVPFSTYRRHLTAGIERITDMLWRKELGE
jgi:hypothetical protein